MIHTGIKGIVLSLETDQAVFSPSGADRGTLAMLSQVNLLPDDKILDLGCGCGIVGIWAAKQTSPRQIIMCDIQPESVELARRNAALNEVPEISVRQSDGLSNIPENGFTWILSNPPYHADFSVPKRFIRDSFEKLSTGGRLVMVTKRRDWYRNRLTAVFGGVRIAEIDGYFVFTAEKKERTAKPKKDKPAMSRKLLRKYGRKERGEGRSFS